MRALASQTETTAAARALALLELPSARCSADVLAELVDIWHSRTLDKRALTAMLGREARTDPELGRIVDAVAIRAGAALARYFASRVEAGELRRDLKTEFAAKLFLSALVNFDLAPQPEIGSLVHYLLEGIASKKPGIRSATA